MTEDNIIYLPKINEYNKLIEKKHKITKIPQKSEISNSYNTNKSKLTFAVKESSPIKIYSHINTPNYLISSKLTKRVDYNNFNSLSGIDLSIIPNNKQYTKYIIEKSSPIVFKNINIDKQNITKKINLNSKSNTNSNTNSNRKNVKNENLRIKNLNFEFITNKSYAYYNHNQLRLNKISPKFSEDKNNKEIIIEKLDTFGAVGILDSSTNFITDLTNNTYKEKNADKLDTIKLKKNLLSNKPFIKKKLKDLINITKLKSQIIPKFSINKLKIYNKKGRGIIQRFLE